MSRIVAKRGSVTVRGKSTPAPSIDPWLALPALRKARMFRRVGSLVGLRTLLARRTACAGCDDSRRVGNLYGCGKCAGCGGAPDRILVDSSVCKRGLWPSGG